MSEESELLLVTIHIKAPAPEYPSEQILDLAIGLRIRLARKDGLDRSALELKGCFHTACIGFQSPTV